jgi:hypothetical protein
MIATLSMSDLLERAGFRLRGRNRADCIHCSGSAIATVALTGNVAYCHRCKWTANTIMLAKELGLLSTDPESRRQRRAEAREIAKHRATIRRFEVWRTACIKFYSAKLRRLGRQAALATQVLNKYPDTEPAWDALARFCHEEGELNQMLDFFSCAKASPWLDADETVLDLFELWKGKVDAKH